MKKQSIYNLNQIVKITVSDKFVSDLYEYKEAKNTGWIWKQTRRAGFYMYPGTIIERFIYETEEEFLKENPSYLIIDKVVYKRPRVIIDFTDGSDHTIHHDNFSDAQHQAGTIWGTSECPVMVANNSGGGITYHYQKL